VTGDPAIEIDILDCDSRQRKVVKKKTVSKRKPYTNVSEVPRLSCASWFRQARRQTTSRPRAASGHFSRASPCRHPRRRPSPFRLAGLMPRNRPFAAPRVSARARVLPVQFVGAAVLALLSGSAAALPSAALRGPTARQLLDHNLDWFRTELTGGKHNALDSLRLIDDQVIATTCLPNDAFVTVAASGKTFQLGNAPFVFAGWNQWEVLEAASDAPAPFRHLPLPGKEHIVRQMNEAVSVGLKVMRMWAHTITDGHALQPTPGVFDEQILRGLDFVLHEAGKRGLKIILAIADNWYPVGGVDNYVKWSPTATKHKDFFTDETAISLFLDTHKFLANRVNTLTGIAYKNDPTIMAWNLANEARCQGCASDVMQSWIERTCASFKQNDPNHLVGIGTEGFYGPDSGLLSGTYFISQILTHCLPLQD